MIANMPKIGINNMTNREIEMWVMNDEGLYSWYIWEMKGDSVRKTQKFIKNNRTELVNFIEKALNRPPIKSYGI
jgi:hypothetical protein